MKDSNVTNWVRRAALIGLAISAIGARADDGAVNIICGVQAAWCSAAAVAFQKDTGIKVNMTSKSGGEALAQFRAEAGSPKVDVWYGGSSRPHSVPRSRSHSKRRTATSVLFRRTAA